MTDQEAADLTGYSLDTVRRWLMGGSMPLCAFRLLMLHGYGLMPSSSAAWAGFRVRDDAIITPEGMVFHANELATLRFSLDQRLRLLDQVFEQSRRIRELEQELRYSQIPLFRA